MTAHSSHSGHTQTQCPESRVIHLWSTTNSKFFPNWPMPPLQPSPSLDCPIHPIQGFFLQLIQPPLTTQSSFPELIDPPHRRFLPWTDPPPPKVPSLNWSTHPTASSFPELIHPHPKFLPWTDPSTPPKVPSLNWSTHPHPKFFPELTPPPPPPPTT